MKTRHHPISLRSPKAARAFTLVEFMVMSTVFILMITAIFTAHLYGLKMAARINIQLGASDDARQAISTMISDIRGANTIKIGTGDANGFTNIASGSAQQGSCMLIYPGNTTNLLATNTWIKYYYNPAPNPSIDSSNTLMRLTDAGGSAMLTANYVTNSPTIFKKIDYTGATSTDPHQQPYSIEVCLSFIRLANPQVPIGNGNYFSDYQVLTRVSPRNQ